ncbi:MAG: Nif3-like dinuclear metal center hexameric protein [Candidatus Thorarchaeota archaeon]|nr:Nif3-like dinuclear metal center hexameric protein [Candidatus Thorarchaeota archaeon]
MTTLRDIVCRLNEIVPREYTVRGETPRVEVGPQNETEQAHTTVSRVLVTTYPSSRAVTKASQDKANLIITSRPLFHHPVDRIEGVNLIRLRLLSKNYISSYCLGTPWISARGGMTDTLVEALGMKQESVFEIAGDYSDTVPVGRVCRLEGTLNHSGFANLLASRLRLQNITFTGDLDDEVREVLVIAGMMLDIDEVLAAKSRDIETIVTGELSPSMRLLASEAGLNVLELGPFVTEEPGMQKLKYLLSLEFPEMTVDFTESPTSYVRILGPYGEHSRAA